MICGRDHTVTPRETVLIRMRATGDCLAAKKVLRDWLFSCVERFRKPPGEIVEVMALDQSSTDWIPEWHTRCVRSRKQVDGVGSSFFLERESSRFMLTDASIWCGGELRVYLIIGPPGTGKTELTIWLAGYLGVPLYRLSLNDGRLSDQTFAQLISPTSLRHDNAVIQIDEFQETLARWKEGQDKGVSMGGFCEVLQGSNSLARGFIILSGTQELAGTKDDPTFAAVFRRISIAPTVLEWFSTEDLQNFFCRLVLDFVPDCPEDELRDRANQLARTPSTWGCGRISIDMVKQFLMQRISSFGAVKFSEDSIRPGSAFRVPLQERKDFFDNLCEEDPAALHLKSYPPVGDCGL